ncbi:FadR family transcriptional regulator [Leekyejoonella antrihumi]|uniref:FadR family transcriptional regulator n=1 Tax=Leekyejoonella antrihumi TaxID=1660198 RepID=A0A563E1S4_9MICO|nr:FadR family transcriptional regulator [Leekyejoonella antrihumi]
MEFQPVKPVRLYQRIVEQVEGAIARGELNPGERLPSERELVAQFGASRSTVREALRVLESTGVVRSRPGDPNGPEVLPFSTSTLAKQLTRLTQAQEVSLADLISFRMVLDSSANMLAARLRTDDELAVMESTIARMRAAIDAGYDDFSAADVAFHDAVAQASGNMLLQVCNHVVRGAVLSLISDKIAHARNSAALMSQSMRHHEEVLALIRDRDSQGAGQISRRNLFDYYASYVPKAEREPLRALLLEPETPSGEVR